MALKYMVWGIWDVNERDARVVRMAYAKVHEEVASEEGEIKFRNMKLRHLVD